MGSAPTWAQLQFLIKSSTAIDVSRDQELGKLMQEDKNDDETQDANENDYDDNDFAQYYVILFENRGG